MCHVTLEVMVTLWDEAERVYVITLGHSGHSAVGFDLMNSRFFFKYLTTLLCTFYICCKVMSLAQYEIGQWTALSALRI